MKNSPIKEHFIKKNLLLTNIFKLRQTLFAQNDFYFVAYNFTASLDKIVHI